MNTVTSIDVDMILTDERLISGEWGMKYGSEMSAGLDVVACIPEQVDVRPGEVILIDLGFKMHLAKPGLTALLMPRSGFGHKEGIVLGNLVGVIDADYQGNVFASIWNRNPLAGKVVTIRPGDRIAQLLIVPTLQIKPNFVTEFVASDRGEGGFGSTGKN